MARLVARSTFGVLITLLALSLAQVYAGSNKPSGSGKPFGSGARIVTPGQPSPVVQPFGSGAIILNRPGQPPTVTEPLGKGSLLIAPGLTRLRCSRAC